MENKKATTLYRVQYVYVYLHIQLCGLLIQKLDVTSADFLLSLYAAIYPTSLG